MNSTNVANVQSFFRATLEALEAEELDLERELDEVSRDVLNWGRLGRYLIAKRRHGRDIAFARRQARGTL